MNISRMKSRLRAGTEVLRTGGGLQLTAGDCALLLEAVETLEALVKWDALWPNTVIDSATEFRRCHDELTAVVAHAADVLGRA